MDPRAGRRVTNVPAELAALITQNYVKMSAVFLELWTKTDKKIVYVVIVRMLLMFN